MESIYMEIGYVVVTPDGLSYDGKMYTCKPAVRKQWFSNVDMQEMILPLYVSTSNAKKLWIWHKEDYFECHPIDAINEIPTCEKELYYQKLQKMKKQLQTVCKSSQPLSK